MKKILFSLFLLFSLGACKDNKEPAHQDAAEQHEHAATVTGLQLQDGKKWKADSSTLRHVQVLVQTLDRYKATPDTTLNGYLQLAAGLQGELDQLVRDCRMQGKDHDMLHLWLEPLMGRVKKLGSAGAKSDAALETGEIAKQLQLFDQYFEL